ncbi:MAG: RluA family pseudouridine synthase [Pseudomonadota bacterium]
MLASPPLPPLRAILYAPPTEPLRVLHADAAILVVDKPAGLLSVPGKAPGLADCLAARAEAAFPGARIVHRLDRDTSGVMVLARDARAQRILGLQFEKRQVAKLYEALAAGRREGAGRIEAPLTADWPERPRQKIDAKAGRPAVTDWQALGPVAALPRPATRFALTPLTGRSHQLRVHLAALGHPILGDALYAPDPVFEAAPRLMLHGRALSLRSPLDGAPLRFASPPPF